MAPGTHEKFDFRSLDEVLAKARELGVDLPVSTDLSPLKEPLTVGGKSVPNSMSVHPMEGCDGTGDGRPDDLTFRRYRRFAAGGAGLLWVEATAVVHEGRANPRQLWLHDASVDDFARLAEETRRAAHQGMGPDHDPLLILQITHSGRYSKPEGAPKPIIAHHSEVLDPQHNLRADYPLISDD